MLNYLDTATNCWHQNQILIFCNPFLAYNTFQDIRNAINNDECKGVLVDIYVAGYHEELDGLAKNNIFDMNHMIYGVVFGTRISDQRTYELFEKFLERKDMTIDLAIAENTESLQVRSFSKFYWYI